MSKPEKEEKKKPSLADKLKKNSKIKMTSTLATSDVYNRAEATKTGIALLDVAASGEINSGLHSGLTVIAGPSKHFKTLFALLFASAFLKQNPDGMILFYMNEFGSPKKYFEVCNIPEDKVMLSPFLDIEELKTDLTNQLTETVKSDKVFIIIDSIGNAASKKEVDDALDGKSVADMTRAKQIKSLFRIATPHLALKDIPMIAINHTYQTQETYSKTVVSGGTGIYYSADTVWVIGRQKETEGEGKAKVLTGHNFDIKIDKSRFVKEGSKFPITVKYDGGVSRWSGLFDLAVQGGFIDVPVQGWYLPVDPDTGEVPEKNLRRADLEYSTPYWEKMIKHPKFLAYIKERCAVGHGNLTDETEYNFKEEDPE